MSTRAACWRPETNTGAAISSRGLCRITSRQVGVIGLEGAFLPLVAALDGVPPGLIGYEEHQAGAKGLHMNFVFVAEVAADAEVVPNDEFGAWRWVDRDELAAIESPLNVRQFGFLALDAELS